MKVLITEENNTTSVLDVIAAGYDPSTSAVYLVTSSGDGFFASMSKEDADIIIRRLFFEDKADVTNFTWSAT